MKVTLTTDDGDHDITEAVQIMYDTVAQSLDFGSGFLDTEEVLQMERLGVLAGFEPLEYPGSKCKACGHTRDQHRTYKGMGHCWANAGREQDGSRRLIAVPNCPCTAFVTMLEEQR